VKGREKKDGTLARKKIEQYKKGMNRGKRGIHGRRTEKEEVKEVKKLKMWRRCSAINFVTQSVLLNPSGRPFSCSLMVSKQPAMQAG
jgi:hypothetical protein